VPEYPKEPRYTKKKKVYTPDFTAKMLGLSMGKQQMKDVDKLLEESFTGLEIRKSYEAGQSYGKIPKPKSNQKLKAHMKKQKQNLAWGSGKAWT